MKPVSFTLPRSKPRFYLYEYAMDETEYKANSKAISTLFTRSEVEGVYETQIPLLLQAVIRLGCHCKVSTKNFTEPILLDFLVAAQSKNPYLSSNTLKKLFLYHSHSDSKGILVLFSESEKIAYVYVIASYSLQLGPIKSKKKK